MLRAVLRAHYVLYVCAPYVKRGRSEHVGTLGRLPLLLDEESGSPLSCSAMLGGSSSWSHFVMAMYSRQSGCVSRTSATCIIRCSGPVSICYISDDLLSGNVDLEALLHMLQGIKPTQGAAQRLFGRMMDDDT